MQAIHQATVSGQCAADLAGIVSDQPAAKGLEYAQEHGLAYTCLPRHPGELRADYDQRLKSAVDQYQPDFVILAGFMRILTADFVQAYAGRLINIHPSLLPDYKGLNTHQRVLDDGCCEHGTTVHFVTPELDAGPAIAQARFMIRKEDTTSSLMDFTKSCEYVIYPLCVHWLATGWVQLIDNQVVSGTKRLVSAITLPFAR